METSNSPQLQLRNPGLGGASENAHAPSPIEELLLSSWSRLRSQAWPVVSRTLLTPAFGSVFILSYFTNHPRIEVSGPTCPKPSTFIPPPEYYL